MAWELLTQVIRAQEYLASGMARSKCSNDVTIFWCLCVCECVGVCVCVNSMPIFFLCWPLSDKPLFMLKRASDSSPHSLSTVVEKELLLPISSSKGLRLHLMSLGWILWLSVNQSLWPTRWNAMIGEARLTCPSLKLGD